MVDDFDNGFIANVDDSNFCVASVEMKYNFLNGLGFEKVFRLVIKLIRVLKVN